MHSDADAAGVVHDVDVFLFQHGVEFVAALVFEGGDAGGCLTEDSQEIERGIPPVSVQAQRSWQSPVRFA